MLSSGKSSSRRNATPTGSGHNRLLKILHVDPEKDWGGGEAQVLGLLSYLSEKGHSTHVLTHPRGPLYERARKLNVRALPVVVRNDLDVRSIPAIRRLIAAERYDVVHLHTKRAHALSMWLPRGPSSPKYVVTRRMDYAEPKNWYQRRLYNDRVDAVVAVSQTVADQLIKSGVTPDKIRVIYSGIDPARFAAIASPAPEGASDIRFIGTAAVLEERKGHRYLLEAARLLKAQGHRFKLLFAGDGSLKYRLSAMVNSLGLAAEVSLCGFVTDMPRFLAGLDVFVLPSLHEGLGVAGLEAMAAGKAVVASRVGGLAEIVLDEQTGILVPPGDPQSMARAISRLLSDEGLRTALGGRGVARVRQYFTLERMAMRNEDCYFELVHGGGIVESAT